MQIETLYEDDDLIIVNKPAGLLVIPDRFNADLPSLNKLIEAKAGGEKRWVVHRLDRETSGVICFAKNEHTHRYLSILFQERDVSKFYAGLVIGNVVPEAGRIEGAIAEHPAVHGKMIVAKKGKMAVTDYKVAEQWPLYALVQFQIHTGRTHQIRVHLAHIGYPLVGDPVYARLRFPKGASFELNEKLKTFTRQALHARRLGLVHPGTGESCLWECELPADFVSLLDAIKADAQPATT